MSLEKAYEETLMDFQIESTNTSFFDFGYRNWIQRQINNFKEKINEIKKDRVA